MRPILHDEECGDTNEARLMRSHGKGERNLLPSQKGSRLRTTTRDYGNFLSSLFNCILSELLHAPKSRVLQPRVKQHPFARETEHPESNPYPGLDAIL